jgi:enamine deaminase RidA (YjgF/YER057c/UK114 family)
MRAELSAAGSSMSRVARLDQYYPDVRCVDAYHAARKEAFAAGQIAPSTSVIVSALSEADATVDVQVIAATDDSGYMPIPVQSGLNRPDASGYTPCLRVGDLIFVAGQLARDASGKLAAHGTSDETDYIVRRRLVPALEAAQSRLDLVLKAQVYLSKPEDLPVFWVTWGKVFGERIPPTTVVALRHPAFLTSEATVEINVVAAHRSAASRIREIKCDTTARAFDGLLFVAGLTGEDVLEQAKRIFAAAGTDLSNVVRALYFHSNTKPKDPGFACSAVQVQGDPIVDLWGYTPTP